MQGLISKYPKGKIGFITPTMSATASTTAKRMTYSDYIRTAAYNNGGIPVFDNITNAGVDYSNTEQYEALCMDSIHLNAEGQKHVSWKYEAFIRSL